MRVIAYYGVLSFFCTLIAAAKSLLIFSHSAYFQELGPAFAGGQYCVVSLEVDAAPYMRLHFFILFLAPVILCLVMMTRVSFGLQVNMVTNKNILPCHFWWIPCLAI